MHRRVSVSLPAMTSAYSRSQNSGIYSDSYMQQAHWLYVTWCLLVSTAACWLVAPVSQRKPDFVRWLRG